MAAMSRVSSTRVVSRGACISSRLLKSRDIRETLSNTDDGLPEVPQELDAHPSMPGLSFKALIEQRTSYARDHTAGFG